MSVQRRGKAWRVRWQEGTRWRSRTFERKRDADVFDAELKRRRRLGSLASIDAGTETLDEYVSDVWAPTFGAMVTAKTQRLYRGSTTRTSTRCSARSSSAICARS
jgi:hypothetical protein